MKKAKPSTSIKSSGNPTWIVTFADLMTLLLTFFILLLSFSNLDAEKYKTIALSMSQAFGVSWSSDSQIPPIVIQISDSSGLPEAKVEVSQEPDPGVIVPTPVVTLEQSKQKLADEALLQSERLATELITKLEQHIAEKDLEVTFDETGVRISFTERASFSSGSEELREYMKPVLLQVVDELVKCTGDILVMGHTDDRPMVSERFRSNWDLSAARAVSVVHQLVEDGRLDASKVSAMGLAETKPLVENTSDENRAKNRRVEVLVKEAKCNFSNKT